jgi:hypothetical protein
MKIIIVKNTGEIIDTLNLNEIMNVDDKSKPICGLTNPLVTACFGPNSLIYIYAYHRMEFKQYNVCYSLTDKKITSSVKET